MKDNRQASSTATPDSSSSSKISTDHSRARKQTFERSAIGIALAAFGATVAGEALLQLFLPHLGVWQAGCLVAAVAGIAAGLACWRLIPIGLEDAAPGIPPFSPHSADNAGESIGPTPAPIPDSSGAISHVLAAEQAVSEREEAEQALRTGEAKFRLLFADNPLPMWVYDLATLRFLEVNEAAVRHYGYSREEFLSQTIADIRPPEDVPRLLEGLEPDSADPYDAGAWRHLKKDGSVINVEVFAQPIPFEGARAEMVLAIDITERARAERALRQSEEKFRSLVSHVPDVIWTMDSNLNIVFISDAIEAMSGFSLAEVYSKGARLFLESIHPDDAARVKAAFEALFRTGAPYEVECRIRRKNGESIWIHDRAVTTYEKDGVRYADGLLSDITARKLAEEEVRQSEEKFRRLVTNLPDVTWTSNELGKTTYVSPNVTRVYGYTPEEICGSEGPEFWLARIHPNDVARVTEAYIGLFYEGRPFDLEYQFQRKDGRWIWIRNRAFHTYDHEGVRHVDGIALDISESKRAEQELTRAKEAAESANRAKSVFLANMSHEIRTPMNGIIGMTDLVLATELTSGQREDLNTVLSSADSLLRVINDILDFSKIEARKLDLERIEFDLRECVEGAAKSLGMHAAEKNLELICSCAQDVPAVLVGDPGRLRQIVVNLVGNALKFTDRGEVVVRVETITATAAEAANEVLLHLSVQDTGIGIPPEKQTLIFDAFAQADTSSTRRFGGTGLGLSIVAQLLELMQGRVWVESVVGRGSTFHVTVAMSLPNLPSMRSPRTAPKFLLDVPVLVADDNLTHLQMLGEMLSNWGMRPTLCAGAEEALARLREARSSGMRFPLLIADGEMHQASGAKLAEAVENDPELAGGALLMLSSPGQAHDEAAAAAQSGDVNVLVYLTKPIGESELLEAIEQVLRASEATESEPISAQSNDSGGRKTLRILVVEDHAINQEVALRLIRKEGHSSVAVASGQEALAAVQNENFDLILMDLQMPDMDGFETTRAIREMERETGRHLPILAMTAHAMRGDKERCLAAGMDGYLAKPVKSQEFRGAIEAILFGGGAERG